MKKLRKILTYIVLIMVLILLTNQYVYAAKKSVNVSKYIKKVEYSDDFKNWVNLSDEDKVSTLYPKIYKQLKTPFISENPIYQATLVGASLNSKFSLSEKIPNNLEIRNQYDTTSCWAFSGLSSLETNLALNDYKNDLDTSRVYDFSERHMNYSSTRNFLNNNVNIFGVNRLPSGGGQWYLVENYLTNGQGAILESEMPFVNSEEVIDISEIRDKNVVTQVYDTVYFKNYNEQSGQDRIDSMNEIKQHIENYGSVFATVHGASANDLESCYNNNTGAKFCNDPLTHKTDHAISIIGWDDNYDISNFPDTVRPSSNGAWIARNSWGENLEFDLAEVRKEIYEQFMTECNSIGIYDPSEIPDELIVLTGFEISGDKALFPVGDHGLMYVSYEDCNVGTTLYGIKSSSNSVDYDNIYQYNELYPGIQLTYDDSSVILCNVFEREQSSVPEYLTEIALTTPETYNCKVYVNPNGDEKTKSDLKLVQLKAGESEEIAAGYHTLEFAEPIEITGDKFTVAVEITGTRDTVDIALEGIINEIPAFSDVKTEVNKCYVSTSTDLSNCEWLDLGTIGDEDSGLINCDSSIKAFTITEVKDTSLNRIEIENPPSKVDYIEGENFDKTGMVVRAYFNDNTSRVLSDSDYNIENGTNLKSNQTYVTIRYDGKTVNQEIRVTARAVDDPNDNPVQDSDKEDLKDQVPKSSNMNSSSSLVSVIQAYFYSDDSSKDYFLLDTEISNVKRDMSNDSYEYFYYISSDPNLKNITDWAKVKEEQKDSDKLAFTVDTRDMPNFDEVSSEDVVYIYIKESVTKGGNQSVIVSPAMRYVTSNAKTDVYRDNVKQYTDNGSNNQSQNNNSNNGNNGTPGTTTNNGGGQTANPQDQTVSQQNLPKTGATLLIVLIVVLIVAGIAIFIRYEVLNRYVK